MTSFFYMKDGQFAHAAVEVFNGKVLSQFFFIVFPSGSDLSIQIMSR